MKPQTRFVFNAVHILIWIVFIGLCIRTGTLIFTLILNLFFDIGEIQEFLEDVTAESGKLYEYRKAHHYAMFSLIILYSAIHAYIAYLAVRIFRKLRLEKPFSEGVTALISRMSYVALGTGILALAAEGYTEWISRQGVDISKNWNGGSFLLLAGIIFILAEVFRRGTELQYENELTV